ncbi:ubiquinol-cytochrome c reductase iron-sulfur subunit [Desulfosporosinus sp. FKB]|uniref:QcrA and Rieske domain-containing protein n=1 Tax=Desulfosporosinus sp. FKB TaxID=1969835 RepID=UPI000B4987C8|nr:ubiquinol-cytochrome c reductase iron-sulfur subunit [Desulfosporosinus sp. FKB]
MAGQIECSRRTVLRFAWSGMVAVGALSVKPLVDYLTSKEDQPRTSLVAYEKSLVEKTDWQHVPNSRVWVMRDDQGIAALVATCTHLGCEVTYHPERKQWLCPCHGSIYDTDGRPVEGPAPKALPRAAVERKADGSLIINTEKQVGLDARL